MNVAMPRLRLPFTCVDQRDRRPSGLSRLQGARRNVNSVEPGPDYMSLFRRRAGKPFALFKFRDRAPKNLRSLPPRWVTVAKEN